MKHHFRVIAYTLTVLFILTCTVPCVLADNIVTTTISDLSRTEYIATVLPQYLAIEGNINYDCIKISSPISVVNNTDDESRIYFITTNNTYIAQLVVTYVNDEYYSSFIYDDNDFVAEVIENDTAFALVTYNDDLIMVTNDESNIISSNKTLDYSLPNFNLDLDTISFSSIDIDTSTISTLAESAYSYNVALAVEYVANETVDDAGICWAACIAAISNFRTGSDYDALDIYNALNEAYSGTPVGNTTWIKRGYSYCDMSYTGTSTMSVSELYSALDDNRPVIFRIYRTEDGETYGHAITLKAIAQTSSSSTYSFMDPNTSSTRYAYFSDTTCDPDDFVYSNGQNTYTSWEYSTY